MMMASRALPVLRLGMDVEIVTSGRGGWQELGRGAYGRVYAGVLNGVRVAVKVLDLDGAVTAEDRADLMREATTHFGLHHENILALLGIVDEPASCDEPAVLGMIYPRMERTIEAAIASSVDGGVNAVPLFKRMTMLQQVFSAVRFLHDSCLVHADLKPANIMLDGSNNPYVGDFGLARIRRLGSVTMSTHRAPRGSPLYMAPELISGTGSLKPACDVYSLAIMAWQTATLQLPFATEARRLPPGADQVAALYAHVRGGGRPPMAPLNAALAEVGFPARSQRRMCALLQQMWAADPAARPTAADAAASLAAVLTWIAEGTDESSTFEHPSDTATAATPAAATTKAAAALRGSRTVVTNPLTTAAVTPPPPTPVTAEEANAALEMALKNKTRGDGAAAVARFAATQPSVAAAATRLIANDKAMGDWTIGRLAGALSSYPQLTALDLSQNDLGTRTCGTILLGKAGAAALARVLPSLPHLTVLCLSDNLHIGAGGYRVLAQALPAVPRLEELRLRSTGIDSFAAEALAGALPSVARLRHLDVSCNNLLSGASKLMRALSALPELRHLGLSRCGLAVFGAENLASSLRSLVQLEHFDVSGNFFDKYGVDALASALPSLRRLQRLLVGRNGLNVALMQVLAPALPSLPLLQHLDVSNNSVGALGELARVHLSSLSRLEYLDGSQNPMDRTDARKLSDALRALPRLQHLNLAGTRLWDGGLYHLANIAPAMSHLRHLDLCGNDIGIAQLPDLTRALQMMPQLTHLDLSCNPFGNAGVEVLSRTLPALPQLASLSLHCCDVWSVSGPVGMVRRALPNGCEFKC